MSVVVSRLKRIARRRCASRTAGEFVAKGFEEPVLVYEVRWQG